MGYKSRLNYLVSRCLRACENNDSCVCEDCFKGDKFKAIKKGESYAGQKSYGQRVGED